MFLEALILRMELFIDWIKDIISSKGNHLAIDGKAIKSARDKINGGNTPYIVSAFLCDIGISIGQVKVMINLMKSLLFLIL